MAGRCYKLRVKLLWVENKVMKRKYPQETEGQFDNWRRGGITNNNK